MRKILIISFTLLALSGCNKKKDYSEFDKDAMEICEARLTQAKIDDLNRFLSSTNMNENVSLSMKDSILTVKIISQADADYSELVDFYHSLAKRSHVWFTGTEIRDSITNKVLARTGYGFNTPFDE